MTYVAPNEHSSQPTGTTLKRPWKFDRICRGGRCRIAFARATLYGPSVTWLVKHGDRFTADFPPVTVPCAYPRGSSYPRHSSGQSHDSYKLRWSHDHSTLLAVEHRVQTGCYAGTSTPDLTRWRAAKVG